MRQRLLQSHSSRRKRWSSAAIQVGLIAVVALGAGMAGRCADGTQKNDIPALYQRLEQAFKTKNLRALVALDADSYEVIYPNHVKLDRARVLAAYSRQMDVIKQVKEYSIKIDKLTVKDKQAIAETTINVTLTITFPQRNLGDISSILHNRDTWEKTADGWRRKRTEVIEQRVIQGIKPGSPNTAPQRKLGQRT